MRSIAGNATAANRIVIMLRYAPHESKGDGMQDKMPKDWLEAELQDTLEEDYEIEL